MDGGQRFATASGAMLADPGFSGNEALFDPAHWAARGALEAVTAGRGAAWFLAAAPHPWVLRHYRRGGWAARVCGDRYVWTGEDRVRAFAEWRLLHALAGCGLPVPQPVAARYARSGLTYRCDLITRRLPNTRPLSAVLASGPLGAAAWAAIGTAVARLHAAGADHADLNAHNILLDVRGAVSVIDFDRGRLRAPGAWADANLSRLRRSLAKIGRNLPADRVTPDDWRAFLSGYRG